MLKVLSLGAGVQSSALLLMSIRGVLPRLDAAIFADTRYEPKAVYRHLEWLKGVSEAAGIPVYTVSVGDMRQDTLDFRQYRKSGDGKRHASIPVFIKNPNGSKGIIRRQCTSTYKIEPVEGFICQQLLHIKKGRRKPLMPQIETWMGISDDEASRAKPPGRWQAERKGKGVKLKNLFGDVTEVRRKIWIPASWKTHAFPLIDLRYAADRNASDLGYLPAKMNRQDCLAWLAEYYPGRKFPRSACICCPFRTNEEWRRMRDEEPDEWADAVEFDYALRVGNAKGVEAKKILVGLPYLHQQLIPLDMVNLDGDGQRGLSGCGMLDDGQDGMCDV